MTSALTKNNIYASKKIVKCALSFVRLSEAENHGSAYMRRIPFLRTPDGEAIRGCAAQRTKKAEHRDVLRLIHSIVFL
ncbi:MAG: hypothetical protein NC041_04525 [Bacteroides sp.]|nr:hypothetical protein [Prevotella sp.]MCM1407970.1 hypothetical protein [Treponema brennaborense]MCM1469712.1 hypothetical protein [Bacteroides sp.]